MRTETDVLVVGLGPVGLFLSYLLGTKGINTVAVDKRSTRSSFSRSIGIHPPLLSYFKQLGLIDCFLASGIQISETSIHYNRQKIFTADLNNLRAETKFVLSIPQYETEKILESCIEVLGNVEICRNEELIAISQNESGIQAEFDSGNSVSSKFLVGCDGIRSKTRELLKIKAIGRDYCDFYGMADFFDENAISGVTDIYLHKDGLLESFPLSANKRRWVARIGNYSTTNFNLRDLLQLVNTRSGMNLDEHSCVQNVSTFMAGSYDAECYFKDRAVILGDSAHVVSPIGGQGMNLGWLGAMKLSDCLEECLHEEKHYSAAFSEYEKSQKHLRNIVSKRAEINMSFGRPGKTLGLRVYILSAIYNLLKVKFIESFTMGNLEARSG